MPSCECALSADPSRTSDTSPDEDAFCPLVDTPASPFPGHSGSGVSDILPPLSDSSTLQLPAACPSLPAGDVPVMVGFIPFMPSLWLTLACPLRAAVSGPILERPGAATALLMVGVKGGGAPERDGFADGGIEDVGSSCVTLGRMIAPLSPERRER